MGIVKAFLRRENWEGAGDRGRAVPVLSIFCRKTARIFIDDLPKSLFSLTFFHRFQDSERRCPVARRSSFFFESRVSSYRRTSLELDQVAMRPAVDYFERTRSRARRNALNGDQIAFLAERALRYVAPGSLHHDFPSHTMKYNIFGDFRGNSFEEAAMPFK